MNCCIEKQNRQYVGEFRNDGYIYYTYRRKVKLKDGKEKIYRTQYRRKRGNKLNKRGKDRRKRRQKSPKVTTKLRKLINSLDVNKQQELFDYVIVNYKNEGERNDCQTSDKQINPIENNKHTNTKTKLLKSYSSNSQ